jgi:aryl-alcohol dehydrogenase-like predicted oxidoreductase
MERRRIGPFEVAPIGLGCMSLSHAYGTPPERSDAERLLLSALDLGYDFFDTAALYGFGANETLVGDVLGGRRGEFMLASKCGIGRNAEGKREINGRPDLIRQTCEDSLRRLKTDVIDLYYLHRWDKKTPIEDSIGALAGLVREGKIRSIGLSEVSAATLRRAHAVHPIAAVQSEYSPWTRNPEIAVLAACRELGTTFVAFSPVGRGFLAGGVKDPQGLAEGDLRRNMPRFQGENFEANLELLAKLQALAAELGATPAQVCLAWVLAKGSHLTAIPGTTHPGHLAENFKALALRLPAGAMARVDALAAETHGGRYNAATQAEIDTETEPSETVSA